MTANNNGKSTKRSTELAQYLAARGQSTNRIETKFVWMCRAARIGERIDGWRICWVGGWDKCRILFVVMVERPVRLRSHHTEPTSKLPCLFSQPE